MIGYGKEKITLKLPPFLLLNEESQEWENSNENKTQKNTSQFNITLNFPALDFPRSKVKKAAISKLFFLFRTLSYSTLRLTHYTQSLL